MERPKIKWLFQNKIKKMECEIDWNFDIQRTGVCEKCANKLNYMKITLWGSTIDWHVKNNFNKQLKCWLTLSQWYFGCPKEKSKRRAKKWRFKRVWSGRAGERAILMKSSEFWECLCSSVDNLLNGSQINCSLYFRSQLTLNEISRATLKTGWPR